MPTLDFTDYVLLAMLPPLLVASGFFSASETVFFGLRTDDRAAIRRRGGIVAAATEALLRDPRRLLVTILLGNMTINTLYMTVTSVLLLRHEGVPLAAAIFGLGTLLAVIVLGEVAPKLAGQTHRVGAAAVIGPPLTVLHRILLPIGRIVTAVVIEPLQRLIGRSPETVLDSDELEALIDLSARQGVIDRGEETLLREVVSFRTLRVRDIMTPRVSMLSTTVDAPPAEVRALIADSGLGRLPIHAGNLDEIVGILPCRSFLLDGPVGDPDVEAMAALCRNPSFVPELASVEQLLARFRAEGSTLAIVVDEFGGTAGLVTIEDVAEELVGEIGTVDEAEFVEPVRLADARWRVGGLMPLHEWKAVFGPSIDDRRVSTVGGLFLARLGRLARPGDEIRLANVRVVAERVESGRVESAIVDLVEDDA
ncbi:MAG: hemolysin family protein [Planctomycetota bacterium]